MINNDIRFTCGSCGKQYKHLTHCPKCKETQEFRRLGNLAQYTPMGHNSWQRTTQRPDDWK